jgi:hypothetical protein
MGIEPELLALRHSDRPGCQFVGYREVAIPIFFMDLRAVVIRERSLPTADEFILRCVNAGASTIESCASILGLTTALIEHRVIELRTKELVELDNSISPPRLVLTAAGAVTAQELSVRELREETLSGISIHGWTRRPILCRVIDTLSPRDAEQAGIVKLRAVPSRHPEAAEIDARALTETLAGLGSREAGAVTEVLTVRAVLKGVQTRFLPALMMQWHSIASGKPQVGFVVDGRLDEELERCFGEMRGAEVFADVLAAGPQSAEQLVQSVVPIRMQEQVRKTLVSEREARELSKAALELQAEREAFEAAASDPSRPDTRAVQAERIKELEEQVKKGERASGNRPRQIWTSDIRHNFHKALQVSKEQLIIVSAFINDDVVNADFISRLDAALRRGAKVFLSVGDDGMAHGDASKRAARERALASLETLEKAHPEHVRVTQRHHHAKILVCDSMFAMTGSYNFLSFRGDHRKVRDEQAVLMQDPGDISKIVKDVMAKFFTPPR